MDFMLKIKKYITPTIVALVLNFTGALMLAFSAGELDKSRSAGIVFWSGPRALHLNHPTMFKWGLYFIIIGFFIQLVSEILKQINK